MSEVHLWEADDSIGNGNLLLIILDISSMGCEICALLTKNKSTAS